MHKRYLKIKRISTVFFINNLSLFIMIIFSLFLSGIFLYVLFFINFKDYTNMNLTANEIINNNIELIDAVEILEKNGWVEITDRDFKIVKSINSPNREGYSYRAGDLMNLFFNGYNDSTYLYSGSFTLDGSHFVIVALPTEEVSAETYQYIVENSRPILAPDKVNNYESFENKINTIIICAFMFFIFLLFSVIYFHSKRTSEHILKPLIKMKDIANSIKNGNYRIYEESRRKDEIGQLSKALAEMSIQLKNRMNKIEEYAGERKKLLSQITHDLKTPLSSVVGYSDHLLVQLQKKQHRNIGNDDLNYLKIINKNGKRAICLIDDISSISQHESYFLQLNLKKENFNEFLRETIANRIPELDEIGFNYEFEIPETENNLFFDRKQISRVMNNLIDNFIFHNPSESKLKITTSRNTETFLTIEDDGVGLSYDAKLFLRNASEKNYENAEKKAGTGLYIILYLLDKHGWNFKYEEEYENGTKFSITIPDRLPIP